MLKIKLKKITNIVARSYVIVVLSGELVCNKCSTIESTIGKTLDDIKFSSICQHCGHSRKVNTRASFNLSELTNFRLAYHEGAQNAL